MIRATLRIAAVLMLAVILGAAWLYLPDDRNPGGEVAAGIATDPASASEAVEKIRSVMEGRTGEVTLSAAEIDALLAGPLRRYIPESVSTPSVILDGGTIRATVPLALESALPLPDVPVVAGIVPDTLRATVRALVTSGEGAFRVHVERLTLGRVPIPGFLISSIAGRLGMGAAGQSRATPAEDPLSWPLPQGIDAVYIDGSGLVLRGAR